MPKVLIIAMGSTGAIGGRFRLHRLQIELSVQARIARGRWEDFMKFRHRRQFLHLAAGTVGLPPVSRIARAQTYPSRPVRIIVAFPAGGGTDIVARLMGQWLSEHLGQQFVIENRAGGGSNIGTEAVVRAPADGYTLHLVQVAPLRILPSRRRHNRFFFPFCPRYRRLRERCRQDPLGMPMPGAEWPRPAKANDRGSP